MKVVPFLRLAIGLAAALGKLHARGLIHKDVKPANILVDPATDQVRLRGFGIASRIRREHQAPEPPEFIAGTLPYMAPEQTGRMNRSIDSRSDLYAFGATLYEMLTGTTPFTASDPMEWIHCQIARHPVPPHERAKSVPIGLSAIVMKLLAKAPEDRYQTASGAESDLRHCLAEWEAHGHIANFLPGEHDVSDRLRIPEKLYGREREIETLLTAFDRVVAGGRSELVLISGYSGIGKSALVNELHRALVAPRGLFASGKFDQHKRDIPYATLAQAFQSLIRLLLSKSEEELSNWRGALHEALNPNAQLMVALVPDLKAIIGDQPPVLDLPRQEAQRRFQMVFRRLVNVFAQPEHPLVVFLDDLQWLDAATLDVIEDLLTQPDVKHLLLIGAYRDNEVGPVHPLARKVQAIRQKGAVVQHIVLAPLSRKDLAQLIADALRCEPADAIPLSELVHDKTSGNPFFAAQFISALSAEGLLTFDRSEARWSWDLDRIRAKGYADNVVDLIVAKLTGLNLETLKVLQQLACFGNSAEFSMLGLVYRDSVEDMHFRLAEAVEAGFILRSKEAYHFLHDRIQEAAYSMIPQRSRAEEHLRIGTLLAAHTSASEREERIFEIVNQLNRGCTLIDSHEDRERLAEFNLIAGRRAKASTAYASAMHYLVAGSELLGGDDWNRRPDLMFSLEFHRAECEFLTGEVAAAEQRLAMLSPRSASTVERATVECLRIDLYATLDQADRAVVACLDYLRHLGIEWSPHPTDEEARQEYERIWSTLGSRTIEDLLEQPLMKDPASLATMDVLTKFYPSALFTDANLLAMTVCRAVNLSLERGHSDGSCVAYVFFGKIAGPRYGDYKAAFRLGQLGYRLVEKAGLQRFQARTYLWFAQYTLPWMKHVQDCRPLFQMALDAATKAGDLTAAVYSLDNLNTNLLAAGDPLGEAQRQAENSLEFAEKTRFGHPTYFIATQLSLIRTLRGLTSRFGGLDDTHLSEAALERHFSGSRALQAPECMYWIRKLQARFFAGDYPAALDAAVRAERILWTSDAMFETAEYHFYAALSHAACCVSPASDPHVRPSLGSADYERHLEALAAHRRQLEVWAKHCPENFENRVALVGAEIARIEGRVLEAEQLYERAIHSAHSNGFVNSEGIAYEIAARFYAARGMSKFADAYLDEARYCYRRWGAEGKVAQLEGLFPQLKGERRRATSTVFGAAALLDVATVIKVSEAVSGRMASGALIDSLMNTAIEHAGADRGVLIVPRGDQLLVKAEIAASGEHATVHQDDRPVTGAIVPESLVRYIVRTQESAIIEDVFFENQFSADPYFAGSRARSLLALPLIKQGKLISILYLENSLAPHVFTPQRIAVLKVLASEAAISLENTRLYHDLAIREARFRRLFDANIMGMLTWRLDGQITGCNQAFLDMVGYDHEDVASGRARWTTLTPREWSAQDERAVAHIKETGVFPPYEKEYWRKDGSRVPVLVAGALFEEGGVEGVAFALDLREQKQAEEGRNRAMEALMVAHEKLARAAQSASLGELAASIAHEINQPLAAVVANGDACMRWLSAAPANLDRARLAAERIVRDGRSAAEFVRKIRGLFKHAIPEKETLDIREVVDEVIRVMRDEVVGRRGEIKIQFESEMPRVCADRVQIQQVIINLVRNALDATESLSDERKVVEIKGSLEDAESIAIEVVDRGCGIEDAEKLFVPFYTTKKSGMGVGLSICRSIVEAHGGRLRAVRNAGYGSRFIVSLPVGNGA